MNSCMPSPAEGPVPARRMRRTSSGASSMNCCATMPPIEKANRSISFRPSALSEWAMEIGRDSGHRVRHLAATRTTDTASTDQDHRAVLRQAVGVDRDPTSSSCR